MVGRIVIIAYKSAEQCYVPNSGNAIWMMVECDANDGGILFRLIQWIINMECFMFEKISLYVLDTSVINC